jgi:hypothetical protein
MPRSGTSITFAAFAAHRDLSWFSNYMDRYPRVPGLAALSRLTQATSSTRKTVQRHGEPRGLAGRLRIAPSEAYNVWSRCCGEEFVLDYLLGRQASPRARRRARRRVRNTMRLQGKRRFATKLTGPGRISYLTSIFPDAQFVHVLRDPRAVVGSLMRVPFWRETFRYEQPAWRDGLTAGDLADWKRIGTPEALAAVQYRAVVRTTRAEAQALSASRYVELEYEEFIEDPHAKLDRLFAFAGLDEGREAHAFVDQRLGLLDRRESWRERLTPAEIEVIEELAR